MYSKGRFRVLMSLVLVLALVPALVQADKKDKVASSKDLEEYTERAQNAAAVLTALLGTPEKGIPEELMERARGVTVLPHVVKAAFGIGGRWGKGLMSARPAGKSWSAPAFVEISGGSFGFQIGAEAIDLVLVFANEKGVKSLLESKLKLGADASVAAGPVGRHGEIGTDAKLNAEIYSYSRSKGLFAGLALDGAVLNIDDSANHKVYGANVTGTDILIQRTVKSTPVAMPFYDAVRRFTPKVSQVR